MGGEAVVSVYMCEHIKARVEEVSSPSVMCVKLRSLGLIESTVLPCWPHSLISSDTGRRSLRSKAESNIVEVKAQAE